MELRILRAYGTLKKGDIIEITGATQQFLLQNGIACVVPNVPTIKADLTKKPCEDCGGDCEDCKSKKKTRNAIPTKQKPVTAKSKKK